MTVAAPSHPFAFDTEFDDTGAVLSASAWRPTKRAYAPAEVDALVAQARLEARQAALQDVDSQRAAALAAVGQAVSAALPSLTLAAQAHREEAARIALAAARLVSGAALDRFPTGALQSAMDTLGKEIESSPRLVINVPALDAEGRNQLERLVSEAGYLGAVAFRDDAGLPAAAFRLEWADGRAEFSPEAVLGRIEDSLNSALAAEAGHVDHSTDGRT